MRILLAYIYIDCYYTQASMFIYLPALQRITPAGSFSVKYFIQNIFRKRQLNRAYRTNLYNIPPQATFTIHKIYIHKYK